MPNESLPEIRGVEQHPLYRAEAYGIDAREDEDYALDYLRWFVQINYPIYQAIAA